MRLKTILLCLVLPAATYTLPIASERAWVSLDDVAAPPVHFETSIPATARLVDGPEGHRAVSVTVPDMGRDEKACAFTMALPELGGAFNGVRLWLKGTEKTRRLEIVLRTDTGTFGTDVVLEPEWRQVMLGAQNTHPFFETREGRLDVARVREVRFCFGEWQGNTGGPHTVSIGPMTAVEMPLLGPAGPVTTVRRPSVPLPLQPFTVDLLDLKRGEWHFADALGQRLDLDGPAVAYAFAGEARGDPRLAYLCCDPEFPEDVQHAVLKVSDPSSTADGATWFRVEEPYFAAAVEVLPLGEGVLRCRLYNIDLGPATTGDRYIAALYVMVGGKACPVWLASDQDEAHLNPRLLTDRVGGVFGEKEQVRLAFVAWPRVKAGGGVKLEAIDYATGDVVWRGDVKAAGTGTFDPQSFTVPLRRFGVFEVSATAEGLPAAKTRVCRIPDRRRVDPDRSGIGINIFQQQIWWYTYQAPLMAKAGVRWIRPWLAWENTWNTQEPKPGQWDTRALDAALRRMEKYGLRYQDILFAAPSWATGGTGWAAPPVEKMGLWEAYVEKLVRQYTGRIRYYEVWNEPDGMWPEATRPSGEHYLAMLKATWAAAKRADPHCVILGLSHAGYEAWLEKVGKLGARDYLDAVTVHVYAPPRDFVGQVERRREILARYGMGEKPLWLNEIGTTAYDFNPQYSARFGCSEFSQASAVTELYAQSLSFDPRMKVFWFCTYDPRDAAHEPEWTGDAGVGVMYLGFLPKLSYAALAGVAKELEGRECLGRQDIAEDLHQISFAGPVAAVWCDRPRERPLVRATDLGCLPEEAVVLTDMFTNQIASGRAGGIKVDLSHGPVYLEGSGQMAAVARAERAAEPDRREVTLSAGTSATVKLLAPVGVEITTQVQPGLPITTTVLPARQGTGHTIVLSAPKKLTRASGLVRIRTRFAKGIFGLAAPYEAVRAVSVTAGEPNLVPDGGFFLGNLYEWAPQRKSPYAWDTEVGHAGPGSLRLDAPFDRRLVHWGIRPTAGRPLKLRCWVKAEGFTGCLATLSLAFFAPDKWLKTWCLATSGATGEIEPGWRTVEACGRIPLGSADWTLVEASLGSEMLPPETDNAAFVVDVIGGGEGRLWIDDIDLWQPAGR
jgi:hypothetical protein